MSRSKLAVFLIVASLAGDPVSAGEVDLGWYAQRIDTMAHQLVEDIRPTLTPDARHILDEIEFQAPRDWVTNADAHHTFGGRRVVEFNAGFLAVTDWLALAMIADWAGHAGCLKEYSGYLAELVGHNSRRAFKGKDRKPVYDFYSYAATSHGQCEGALETTLDDGREQELREEILNAAIAIVVLHEIAHHVLAHVDIGSRNFLQERMREIAADQWAIRT
ncbi:MAG TPA: hypothetical protein VFZ95_09215, partial [Steroidobacteraceae bacterium]